MRIFFQYSEQGLSPSHVFSPGSSQQEELAWPKKLPVSGAACQKQGGEKRGWLPRLYCGLADSKNRHHHHQARCEDIIRAAAREARQTYQVLEQWGEQEHLADRLHQPEKHPVWASQRHTQRRHKNQPVIADHLDHCGSPFLLIFQHGARQRDSADVRAMVIEQAEAITHAYPDLGDVPKDLLELSQETIQLAFRELPFMRCSKCSTEETSVCEVSLPSSVR